MANEARLHIRLEAAEANKGVSGSVPGRPVLPWRQVLRQIAGKLEAAADMARKTASVSDADQLALDAYFECFEASELETAVLLFRGEERKFALERKFAAIRRPLLADLAAGRTDMEHARAAIHELVAAIEVDIAALYDQGVVDRTALGSTPGTAKRITSQVGSTDVSAVMVDLRRAFEEVSKFADQGNSSAAAGALADAYFHVFHRIEPALASTNYVQMRQIENRFLELRGSIRSGLTPESVRTNLDALWAQIDVAATALRRSNQTGFTTAANRFWNAFIILSREGVEALLIITALLLYLDRCQRPQAKRLIYVGILLGVLATLVTWSGLQWVIAQSGVAQETIEGVSALAAGAVLFYVSYWLVSKSEARQWQQFLARQVDRHLTTGSRWAIGLAAFLAVYREGAETILMFQPMLVQPTAQELTGAIAGVGAAIVALAAVFWGLRFASFRLAIRPFFRVTGVLLFTLAIVFAGKGIAELQEARVLTVSPLPLPLHRFVMGIPSALRDALGITANVQALAIQATILSGVLLSLLSMWLMAPRTPEGDGRRIVQPSRTENECATSAL